jgi:hypothetical protein
MPKRLSKPKKRPTDVNQLAHLLGDQATQEREPTPNMMEKPPTRSEISRIMAAMGSKGGKKSAKSRMKLLTSEQRSSIALKAAKARWTKGKNDSVEKAVELK